MILYHGSPNVFEAFQISKELVRTDISNLAEGLGVYMTTDPAFAESYGQYVYAIEVDEDKIIDLTDKNTVVRLVKKLDQATGGMIARYISIDERNDIISSLMRGESSATNFGTELDLHIDSNERYHTGGDAEKEIRVQALYEESIVQKYVLKYHEPQFSQVVFVAKNVEFLRIVPRTGRLVRVQKPVEVMASNGTLVALKTGDLLHALEGKDEFRLDGTELRFTLTWSSYYEMLGWGEKGE